MGQDIRQSYFQHFIALHDEKPFNPSRYKKLSPRHVADHGQDGLRHQLKAERPDGIDLDQRLRKPVAAHNHATRRSDPDRQESPSAYGVSWGRLVGEFFSAHLIGINVGLWESGRYYSKRLERKKSYGNAAEREHSSKCCRVAAVSYTHLTLPTIYSV